MAKIEGTSKRRRDDDQDRSQDHAQSQSQSHNQDLAVPRNKITSSLHGLPDKTEYQHGAILKVSMKSFVTYESCSFTPGPNLNMIIGPNGTGKSTIVCALALGLGWNTGLLGRAKDISEFVKHGSDKGWIEIVLCNRQGANAVIKRHINKNNNSSIWKINGENKTQKEVQNKVESFDIQVDNLCQFLPQDRVSEFAQMTPQELLRETQRAVGGEESLEAHKRMVELWNNHKSISASMKGDQESIETNEKRNAVIEKDVFRFQQREAVLRKVRLLEIWIKYAQYGRAKDDYNRVKEERRLYQAQYKKLETEVEPWKKKQAEMVKLEEACTEEKARLDKQYHKAIHALKSKGAAIESVEGDAEELRKDLDRHHAKLQQRQATINNLKRKIAAQQELLEVAQSEEEINKEKEAIQEKLTRMQDENRATKDRIEILLAQQTDIVDESKRINSRMIDSRKRLDALDDIRNRRLQQLRQMDFNVFDAVMWLRDNRHLFQKHVFEPVCLEINMKNMKHVNAVENALRNHLKTFVCQSVDDYKIFAREVIDKKGLRVNVIGPTERELNLDNFRPPVPSNQLGKFGFDCYMLDAIDGPPALLAVLCAKANVHSIPVSDTANVNFQAIRDSRKFRRYATSTTIFTVTYSRHTGESMDSASPLRPAQVFTASVDHEERARLIREVDGMRSTQEQNESQIRQLTVEENSLRKVHQEYLAKKDILSNERRALMASIQRHNKQKIELEALKKDLDRKENESASGEEEEKIRQQLRMIASKRCKLTLNYLELARESQQLFSRLTFATLNRLQVHTELQETDAQCSDVARQLKEVEERYKTANREYDDIKARAKAILDDAKAEYNKLEPEEAADFQAVGKDVPLEQLEDMHAGESAKAALHYTPNKAVLEKFEQRQKEIKVTKEQVEAKEKKLSKIAAEIEAIHGPWYAKISDVVRKISDGFSKSFEQIGCAGEVKLGEHEDYDQWSIEILVKFRDAEKLQKLTGQRQSGGERSVSTIMYLMALQSLSKVSFRVVDEINQGMDPRNERLVHSQLVEKACTQGTAQYFLITPKLLPNLDYHERMKVLCIYNGEWLDEGVMKWGRYLENQQRSKARRV